MLKAPFVQDIQALLSHMIHSKFMTSQAGKKYTCTYCPMNLVQYLEKLKLKFGQLIK